ncbi:hypothetical protein C3K47_08165 [Solitalea longa]|uniref:VWFA domain-containing protein n=1 Tax=Solitalea longa TaxID=2079460 RepID=A0A2S5A4J0_9SPHI|nr:von Willebrand factor type A domain-containing protein [Solitalea longa]POY37023.1 hypothetical protein C3K47_08165 [Solitalea longa]
MKARINLLLLVLLVVMNACSQPKVIQGRIKAADSGAPLKNAEIVLKGTKIKSHSNSRGVFNIHLTDSNNVLIISAKGYESKEIKLNDSDPFQVMLVPKGQVMYDVNMPVKEEKLLEEDKTMIRASEDIVVPQMNESFAMAPAASFNTEDYSALKENGFKQVSKAPLSTFSTDVDRASYTNVRRFINMGQMPPIDAVRVEEMINYFDYDYAQPTGNEPVVIHTEVAVCPWNNLHKLARIGVQAKRLETKNLPASNIVFLIDVSGSMEDPNKLPLVKSAFKLLTDQLRANDKVAIVVYAGAAGVVLPSTKGDEKTTIKDALNQLEAGGSTAGGEGIELAYKIATQNFITNGNNRVIIATDGDFNVGASSDGELQRLIEEKRKRGVFLSVLGFGMGNYKDNKLELLADKGNGNYAYIDNFSEAKRVFVNEFGGTLFTLAKDVKLQVEFNPATVQSYRLVGYENRLLNDEDFNDDKVDAGEIGSGQTVTALYEIIPVGVKSPFLPASIDPLKYQNERSSGPVNTNELMTVKLRYKEPVDSSSKLISVVANNANPSIETASASFRFAAAVAEFGMLLRNSVYKNQSNYEQVVALASTSLQNDPEGYKHEFVKLVKTAKALSQASDKNVVGSILDLP